MKTLPPFARRANSATNLRLAIVGLLTGIAAVAPLAASATTTSTWTGSDCSSNCDWSFNFYPTLSEYGYDNSNVILNFAGSSDLTKNFDDYGGITIAGIEFANGAGAFVLNGGGGGDIIYAGNPGGAFFRAAEAQGAHAFFDGRFL
jgi:hypothetical protein